MFSLKRYLRLALKNKQCGQWFHVPDIQKHKKISNNIEGKNTYIFLGRKKQHIFCREWSLLQGDKPIPAKRCEFLEILPSPGHFSTEYDLLSLLMQFSQARNMIFNKETKLRLLTLKNVLPFFYLAQKQNSASKQERP